MNKRTKKTLVTVGILILAIIVVLFFLTFTMLPQIEAPAPTPQSIHKQQTLYDMKNCRDKVERTVFAWAENRGLQAQNRLSKDRAAIFIVPDETYFIEFFYEFRRGDEETDLSLGLIPSRQTELIDYSQLRNQWQGLEMSSLWESIVFNSSCQLDDIKETLAGGVGCVGREETIFFEGKVDRSEDIDIFNIYGKGTDYGSRELFIKISGKLDDARNVTAKLNFSNFPFQSNVDAGEIFRTDVIEGNIANGNSRLTSKSERGSGCPIFISFNQGALTNSSSGRAESARR